MTVIAPVRWDTDRLILVDQTVLPEREVERGYQSWQDVGAAIRDARGPRRARDRRRRRVRRGAGGPREPRRRRSTV